MARHWKSLTLLVVPVMLFGYISSAGARFASSLITRVLEVLELTVISICSNHAGILVAIFPQLTYQSALVISATLTPTDPILAAAIVGGHYADKNVSLAN